MFAESIGETAFLGLRGREALDRPLPGGAGSAVAQNWSKTLMRKAVWSTKGLEIGEAKRKFRLTVERHMRLGCWLRIRGGEARSQCPDVAQSNQSLPYFFVTISNVFSNAQSIEEAASSRYFGADADTSPPPSPHLSEIQLMVLAMKRVCIRSYGLPGGAENLPNLTSADLLREKKKWQKLFDLYDQMKGSDAGPPQAPPDLSDSDRERFNNIRFLDRPQVSLYGEWLYLRSLRAESRYDLLVPAAEHVVAQYQLSFKPVASTGADDHTYFSSEALGNMILLELVRGKGEVHSTGAPTPTDLALLIALLDARPALHWLFQYTGGDPLPIFLVRFRNLYDQVVVAKDGTPTSSLGHSDFVAGYFAQDGDKVVLVQGKQIYGLKQTQDKMYLLEPGEAAHSFDAFCEHIVTSKSTDQMRLFVVNKFADDYYVFVGSDTIQITPDEFQSLRKGIALPNNHFPSKMIQSITSNQELVLYSDPLILRSGKMQTAADDFVFALAKSYPTRRVYRDPYSDQTSELVSHLASFNPTGTKNVYAVMADDSFAVQDWKIMQNVKGDLTKNGITVISFTETSQPIWQNGEGKGLIVITGHIDEHLAAFVHALGDKGYLKGNYVVFNSCRSPLTRQLISKMNVDFGAAATFAFDSTIDDKNAEDFLVDFSSNLKSQPTQQFDVLLRSSLEHSKLNGIWTVCRVNEPLLRSEIAAA